MSEKFSKSLNRINGLSAYSIWKEIKNDENNIDTKCLIKEIIDFFEFAISKNKIVEYDTQKKFLFFLKILQEW